MRGILPYSKYPEEVPLIEVVPSEEDEEQTNLEDDECEDLSSYLTQQVRVNEFSVVVEISC